MMYRLLLALLLCAAVCAGRGRCYVFIGSYTGGVRGTGIYVYTLDTATGALQLVSTVDSVINSSFVALSPDGHSLYACTEARMKDGGASMFSFDSVTGKLSYRWRAAVGVGNPVFTTIDRSGRWGIWASYGPPAGVYVHNLQNGWDTSYSFAGHSVDAERQDQPHIHAAVLSPREDYVFFPDLGADVIRVFPFRADSNGPLGAETDVTVAVGSGPRHLVFHPSGRYAWCTEELSGTVAAYKHERGGLQLVQRLASYKNKQEHYACSDLKLSPDGRFLYVLNREEEHSITIFATDSSTGKLSVVGRQPTGGLHPRYCAMDPWGKYLLVANQESGNVVVLKRDSKTGLLRHTGRKIKIPHASCVVIKQYE